MKKLLLFAFIAFGMIANAQQNYVRINIADIESWETLEYCKGTDADGVIIEKEANCSNPLWGVMYDGQSYQYHDDTIVIQFVGLTVVEYYGCVIDDMPFYVELNNSQIAQPWTQDHIWKRAGDAVTLTAPYGDGVLHYKWSTGSTARTITVTQPGTYWLRQWDNCGERTDTIRVLDNVEIYRTTTDLRSNLNMVTWHTGLDYFESVNIYRNNQLVATVPYADGQFVDDIGSEATQWQYHICGVLSGREECPIKSYWKRTIHTWESVDGQGNCNLNWTSYEGEDGEEATAYRIFDYTNNELVLKMEVGNFTNSFTYNPADYDGYGVVGAVFANKSEEDLSLSNHTSDVLAVGEQQQEKVSVYPNPAHGQFTISGTGKVVISNTLGQTVKEMEIDGKQMIELPSGIYFIQSGNASRKLVVQ